VSSFYRRLVNDPFHGRQKVRRSACFAGSDLPVVRRPGRQNGEIRGFAVLAQDVLARAAVSFGLR
jgi:hypothetical protein